MLYHKALLHDDPLINLFELFGNLEVHLADLVNLHLNILLLTCCLNFLHFQIVTLLAKILKLYGVPGLSY